MRQRTSQLLFQYWNDVRGERMAPERFDIEPSRIAGILPETCIFERDGEHAYQFRLAGTRICDNWGRELRGTSLHLLALPGDRPVLDDVMETVTDQGAVALFEFAATTRDGRDIAFEALLLPLLHMTGTVSRYLGAISPIDPPAWLGTEVLTAGPLISHAVLWPDGRPYALIERNHRQAPFLPAMAGARIVRVDRRQFRVFDGGRAGEPAHKPAK
ncbi:MAG: PAS domain-containing protein [Hyphomicrobiaceae bacterium]